MENIFKSINQYLKKNNSQTYGDLLDGKNDDFIKRSLSGNNLSYYLLYKKNDKNRLYIDCGNNKENDIVIENKIDKYVSGIGVVQQIM